jgi:ArsR family transcriptional regulator, arsenate/arsenite/antimonite-responsive transcriptional repressor
MNSIQENPIADRSEQFAALSHPLRLQVIELLVDAPSGVPAGVIAEKLQVRQNTLSTHLAQLSRARFINGLRRGREIIYSLNHGSMSELQSTVGKMYRPTP